MPEVLPKPDPMAFDSRMRAQALAIHAKDQPPRTRGQWEKRRAALRQSLFSAMGPFPDQPCPLQPRTMGVLKREGYRIELVVIQSRPNVWVTGSLYLPSGGKQRRPAVLCVHGHWAGARRDPVVQARCLGLVKLGFVVLVVDAFGSGERYTSPARGTYHGALYGSTLWPAGQTLLGMQVYDNRRAVDYLQSRPEVDGSKLGITGASGGGNQTMYAGALDERFGAVVPVCSVGTYQAYLHAACCVCEVMPGALRFAEEGDVLALTAPRALMIINASRDGFQFSPGQAEISVGRARPVFELYKAGAKLRHVVFDSPHDYNKAMREAMYGWMTRWLKNKGDGSPIPEPEHQVDKPEDLACYGREKRPGSFLFPPTFAAHEARTLVARVNSVPDHAENWESTAVSRRTQLRQEILGGFPRAPRPAAKLGQTTIAGTLHTTPLVLHPEPGMPVPALFLTRTPNKGPRPACVLLHLDGKNQALKDPLADSLLEQGWTVLAPDLRATGETRPDRNAISGAPDHNSAEHALWLGRPLLGQWVFDVQCLLDWLSIQPNINRRRLAVAGLDQAGIVALSAGALLETQVAITAAIGSPATLVTSEPYPAGMRIGLLAPGLLRIGDIPHLAALCAPRRLILAQGRTLPGKPLPDKALREAFRFVPAIYRLFKAQDQVVIRAQRVTGKDFPEQ